MPMVVMTGNEDILHSSDTVLDLIESPSYEEDNQKLQVQLEEKDAQLEEVQKQLNEIKKDLSLLQISKGEADDIVKSKLAEIEERDAAIDARDTELEERDAEIGRLSSMLGSLTGQLNESKERYVALTLTLTLTFIVSPRSI